LVLAARALLRLDRRDGVADPGFPVGVSELGHRGLSGRPLVFASISWQDALRDGRAVGGGLGYRPRSRPVGSAGPVCDNSGSASSFASAGAASGPMKIGRIPILLHSQF